MKEQGEFSADIIYSDPPYALGSEVIVRKDGKVDYKKANDFMNKWDMPSGEYWEQWFNEAYRTLKYGGYCIMFGMDRQLLLFKYYAHLSGFQEQQSIYWYFISNFPKATDLSKMIDKNAGVEREVIGINKNGAGNGSVVGLGSKRAMETVFNITEPSTDIAKKYEGYKYSISPLKQTNETIMVFQKPYKTGSCLHDTLAYENGDKECCCGALDIDGNRVGTESRVQFSGRSNAGSNTYFEYKQDNAKMVEVKGRYPAQTFIDSEVAEVLDRQGDVAKILHKCDYEESDIYFYQPKVSKSERNAGCEGFEEVDKYWHDMENTGKDINNPKNYLGGKITKQKARNTHPTLKPIKLNERILNLFKTPNPQKILYPFAR